MKKPDFISIFIAVLISTFIFLFHEMRLKEMKKSDNNLGDISVNSITIEKGGGLYIRDLNGTRRFLIDLKDNEITMGLIDKEGSLFFNVGEQAKTRGFFLLDKTSDAGLMFSTLEDGGAAFSLQNVNGLDIVRIIAGPDKEGLIALYDRNGNIGWLKTGK